MNDVDPADPITALRLVKSYPGAVTAVLPEHEGRAYANLLAAYCLAWPNEPAIYSLLLKGANKSPGMARLITFHLYPALCEPIEQLSRLYDKVRDIESSTQEKLDFIDIVVANAKMVP